MSTPAPLGTLKDVFVQRSSWKLSDPQGGVHASINEDVYNGMRIPKKASIITNIWWVRRLFETNS